MDVAGDRVPANRRVSASSGNVELDGAAAAAFSLPPRVIILDLVSVQGLGLESVPPARMTAWVTGCRHHRGKQAQFLVISWYRDLIAQSRSEAGAAA